MSELNFSMFGNIDHLMKIEKQSEKDDEPYSHIRERIKLKELINDNDTHNACTFDPMKT